MKKFSLPTRYRPVIIEMSLQTDRKVEIFIIGYDPASINTEYFTRRITVDGQDKVYFNCPQSPGSLKVIAWSPESEPFKIPEVQIKLLKRNLKILGDAQKDIEFIEKFSRRSGRLPKYRTYAHKGARFKIQYLPVIRKENGKVHPTPARIHKKKPIIQVSKRHFNQMSIPQRVAILAHEYSHNFVNGNKDDEYEADENMVDIYQGLGYGSLEAIYAFANIMPDTDVNFNRLINIQNQL